MRYYASEIILVVTFGAQAVEASDVVFLFFLIGLHATN